MVGNDLHGLFLAHQETQTLVFAVTEDAGFTDTTFFPGFVSGAFVEECFSVEEHFGAEGTEYFL
jgi:hypothetical protein